MKTILALDIYRTSRRRRNENFLVTVTFETEADGKTKMTLRHKGFPPGEMSDLTQVGWNESFDKLAESLRSMG